jgi:hypothetical protein
MAYLTGVSTGNAWVRAARLAAEAAAAEEAPPT